MPRAWHGRLSRIGPVRWTAAQCLDLLRRREDLFQALGRGALGQGALGVDWYRVSTLLRRTRVMSGTVVAAWTWGGSRRGRDSAATVHIGDASVKDALRWGDLNHTATTAPSLRRGPRSRNLLHTLVSPWRQGQWIRQSGVHAAIQKAAAPHNATGPTCGGPAGVARPPGPACPRCAQRA